MEKSKSMIGVAIASAVALTAAASMMIESIAPAGDPLVLAQSDEGVPPDMRRLQSDEGVPQNLVQRWLGHASATTTAIYLDAVGIEEREFAERMW